jgi:outer membrane protein assembly factor BamB
MAGMLLACLVMVQVGVHAADLVPANLIADNAPHGLVTLMGLEPVDAVRLGVELPKDRRYHVQCLAADSGELSALRSEIGRRGLSGRISVRLLTGNHLPYANNMVNCLVVGPGVSGMARTEIERVLVPEGMAIVAKSVSLRESGGSLTLADVDGADWVRLMKPRCPALDSWTHFAYDATGTMVSGDREVGVPRHLQWVAGPRFTRSHEHISSITAVVSEGGRIFSIIDEGPTASIYLPARVSLVARDAFNGLLVWKKPIANWHTHLFRLKSGPQQLARRLVAVDGKVYVTLGMGAAVSVLDGATGEVETVLKDTEDTSEILWVDDKLALQFGSGLEKPATLGVYDLKTNRMLWRSKPARWVHSTLTSDGDRVYACAAGKVHCLDIRNGTEMWVQDAYSVETRIATNQGPGLLVHDGVLVVAAKDQITALSAATGAQLWRQETQTSDYQAPTRVFLVSGLVWTAAHPAWPRNGAVKKGTERGIFKGFDFRTGELKKQIDVNPEEVGIIHHRCYIPKAVGKYILTSWPGIEFVDTAERTIKAHNWIRGACLYGIMPANGMIYAPPNPCVCYNQGRQYGYLAVSDMKAGAIPAPAPEKRLQKGPAYDPSLKETVPTTKDAEWHTFRGDNTRGGYAPVTLNDTPALKWNVQLGVGLTPPVVVEDRLYVADKATRAVHAVDVTNGKAAWRFAADAMVDSPPTCYGGSVYFGCRDGYVYCLSAADGTLRWRFLAAQEDRQIIAYDRIESQWPVHGSVTIQDDRLYFVAGRNPFMDNGMDLYCLDPFTGRQLAVKRIYALNENHQQPRLPGVHVTGLNIDTTGPDILSSDGKHLFLRHKTLSLDNEMVMIPEPGGVAHLYASMGFLDDNFFHRTYWVYDQGTVAFRYAWVFGGKGRGGGRPADNPQRPSFGSHLAVMDAATVYHFGKNKFAMAHPKQGPSPGYFLAAAAKKPQPETRAWLIPTDVWVRSMLVTETRLFIAGPSGNWHTNPDVFEAQNAVLRSVVKATGEQVGEVELEAAPVFNGMAAAGNRAYLSLTNGTVVCLE